MGRPPKVKRHEPPTLEELAPLAPSYEDMALELAALRSDLRIIAAYIADKDQLRINGFGARISEIALEQ